MSSVTAEFAQMTRRAGYFICLADVSGYNVTQNATTNSWSASLAGGTTYSQNAILEDMGEVAKVDGSILRKVRQVATTATGPAPAGGAAATFFIVVPGGEYPIAGYAGSPASATFTGLAPSRVARLG